MRNHLAALAIAALAVLLAPPVTASAAVGQLDAVVNAAGYGRSADLPIGESRDGVALESSAVAFGTNLAPFQASAAPTPCTQVLANRAVVLTDHQGHQLTACLTFVSFGQVNFYLPRANAPFVPHDSLIGEVRLVDTTNGNTVSRKPLPIRGITPGLFSADSTGFGLPAGYVLRVRADGSQSQEPISGGVDLGPAGDRVFLVLYGTGIRLRTPGRNACVVFGGVVSGGEYRPGTFICGAQVPYAGPAPGITAVDQVNVEVPRDVPDAIGAEVFLRVFLDDPGQAPAFARWSNVLSVAIR
ncbi:hypothetical protein ACFFQW_25320 [Umezawaea endophytica]|uniref:Neocarzinostatin family protein n=1 Tax=Umezawaea endophytica TaxID=1654476 RepID=A0A9X2VRN5_9PSEU|nr:hypothetical protein [Umezawaea endophytica]MCS7481551.1 hypothetical protein [Umezawaea endophytica]